MVEFEFSTIKLVWVKKDANNFIEIKNEYLLREVQTVVAYQNDHPIIINLQDDSNDYQWVYTYVLMKWKWILN